MNEGFTGTLAAVGLSRSPLHTVAQITGDGFRVEVGALQNTLESAPHLQLMLSRYAAIRGRGEVREAIQNLDRQGQVHEIQRHDERIAAIAKDYAKSPENTLAISPDNRSRMEINERVHAESQRSGRVSNEEHRIMTLVPRQDLTGADRTWAERYQAGDVLRYSRASKETGIGSRVRTGLRKSSSWDKVSAATARSVRNSQHAHDS